MSRTVPDKLGFKPGMTARVFALPEGVDLALPEGEAPALIVAFVATAADVAPRLAEALPLYRRGGALWFAYPKKTGAIKTDISRDSGWEPLAAHDLLPVTQIAIDATWSALRFRYRDEIPTLTRKF
ncbi:hypothetical protein [Sphingomonas sp.]|uniref:hypothetical protein n=1 Tax=Sphingomonas sp. TaxID=28214 RepID=UPI001DB66034|nr:hypothetical protein [Sphingomonas sp.]MBX9797397.1 hypothetical protein [Sphingomonas sp.]